MNFFHTLTLILLAALLTGCHIERAFDYPDEYKMYHLNGKYPKKNSALAEQTKQDMLSCGFANTYNNQGYGSRNTRAIYSLCMDQKGYLIDGKLKTCEISIYKHTETCKTLN